VYRARDSKLGRDVALKLLSPLFTADADRVARFDDRATFIARRVSWSFDGRFILAAVGRFRYRSAGRPDECRARVANRKRNCDYRDRQLNCYHRPTTIQRPPTGREAGQGLITPQATSALILGCCPSEYFDPEAGGTA
jgi:hypothetical protein